MSLIGNIQGSIESVEMNLDDISSQLNGPSLINNDNLNISQDCKGTSAADLFNMQQMTSDSRNRQISTKNKIESAEMKQKDTTFKAWQKNPKA